jgi:ribosomal protein S18 acetylase RimI-like enzyme
VTPDEGRNVRRVEMTAYDNQSRTRTVVRAATGADLPRLGRLGATLVAVHHAFDQRRFLPARDRTPTDYADFLLSQLNHDHVVLLVAEINGDVIGYGYATVEGYDYMSLRGPAGVLQDLVVDAQYRGHGVGQLLLDAVLEALQERDVRQVVLSTAEQNSAAQRLFERAGFRRTMVEMTRDN